MVVSQIDRETDKALLSVRAALPDSEQTAVPLAKRGKRALRESKTPSAPAVDRALSLLELLADSKHGLAMPEVMRQLSLSRSSAYYLLVTLERRGYLHRSTTSGRYTFGLKLLDIAKVSMSRNDLRERAQPVMRRLAETTGLTVHLGIMEEDQAIIIARSAPPLVSGTNTWVGKRLHLHSSAIGKVLLAHLPEPEVDRLVRRQRLPRFNDNTITSPARLAGELERVRICGYACEREEEEIGFRCVAAPLRDSRGVLVAAVSLSGTTDQMTDERAGSQIQAILALATQIGDCLGYAAEPMN